MVLQNISLDIKAGEFLTILGPSGCGKTTLLRLISGLERATLGKISIDGRCVNDVPAQQRHVNTVFQSYALFPHMSVFENIAFGLRCQNINEAEITQRVNDVLAMVKLTGFSKRKPQQLSGGQQQRVALARAIVNKPKVLLLDEPLSALDYRLRQQMQLELKSFQRQLGITFILVTHDQQEALSISDSIVVMNDGRIEQVGTPRQVYETPVNLSVARFIGEANIFACDVIDIIDKKIKVSVAGREFLINNTLNLSCGNPLHVLIRPEDFSVWDRTEVDSDEKADMIPATVESVIYKGSTVDLRLRAESGELILATEFFDEDDGDLNYRIGEKVWAEWTLDWEELLIS